MLKIQIIHITGEDVTKKRSPYVIVNDVTDKESFYLTSSKYAHFYKEEVANILISHTFYEVGEYFSSFSFNKGLDWWNDGIEYTIDCKKYFQERIPKIRINLDVDVERWSKVWSILEFSKEFQETVEIYNNKNIKYYSMDEDESVLNGFGIECCIESLSNPIKTEADQLENILKEIVNVTIKRLISKINNNSIVTYFQFPDEIKTVCCQYLIYFTQFIADIGIEVSTELKEEANQILFRVIPKNQEDALSKIQEALSIYLNAPTNREFSCPNE